MERGEKGRKKLSNDKNDDINAINQITIRDTRDDSTVLSRYAI